VADHTTSPPHNWQAYKIQPQPMVTWPVMRNAVVMNFWNQILYLIPSTVLHIYVQGVEELPAQAPTLLQVLWEVLLCLVVYDTVYFFWHLMHHRVNFLFDVIHAVHHEFHAPFSWIAQHVHPLELIQTGCIAIAVPKALGCHPLCTWTWLVVLTLLRIESHCGYSFPFQLTNLVPFGAYGGAEVHDHHHQAPEQNLQPFLTYWDRLFGTYVRPVHTHIGKFPRDESGREDSPSVVFHMFLLPDIMVRWFDVEYQAHCYALLHSARPNIIHVVSFLAFINSFFAATAALNNLTKNLTLLLASLFLCSTMYRPYCVQFRLLVIGSLLLFWCAGHVAVAILGAYVVQQCYVVVVTASMLINMLWQFNSDLFWGCPGAFQTHGIQRSPEARCVHCACVRARVCMYIYVCMCVCVRIYLLSLCASDSTVFFPSTSASPSPHAH
jgi:sterol desaturase/sphingolipid hydroxylase (fatty acid hydroxylase superfamily)